MYPVLSSEKDSKVIPSDSRWEGVGMNKSEIG